MLAALGTLFRTRRICIKFYPLCFSPNGCLHRRVLTYGARLGWHCSLTFEIDREARRRVPTVRHTHLVWLVLSVLLLPLVRSPF